MKVNEMQSEEMSIDEVIKMIRDREENEEL